MMFSRLSVSNNTHLAWVVCVCAALLRCMHGNFPVSRSFWCCGGQDPGLQESTLHQVCLIFCLENKISFPDSFMSEQYAGLSQCPAVPCSPQCPQKLCYNVMIVVYMSSQLVTVSKLHMLSYPVVIYFSHRKNASVAIYATGLASV